MTTAPRQITRGLFGNSFALLATTQITAVLGYLFWMVCAHGFSAGVIGVANTVNATMTLVAMVTVSGFVPMLTRLLPGAGAAERSGLCSTAFVLTAVASTAAGAVAAMLLPESIHAVVGTGWLVAFLSAGALGTSMLLVSGAVLLGVRRAELSLISDAAGSVSRLGAVVAVLATGWIAATAMDAGARTIIAAWVCSLFISVVLSLTLFSRAQPDFRFRPRAFWIYRIRHSVGLDHMAALAVRTPPFLIPILASVIFQPAELGYLAVTAMIASAFFAVGASVSNALLADCAGEPERLLVQIRRAARLTCLLLLPPVVVTCLLAREVLSFFGPGYGDYSALLIVLLLATIPDAFTNVAVAVLRVRRRLRIIAAVTLGGAVVSVGGSWILMPRVGVLGAGWAIVTAQVLVAAVFAVVLLLSFVKATGTVRAADTDVPAELRAVSP